MRKAKNIKIKNRRSCFMEIVPCGKGHFYDKSRGECPQCAAERAAAAGISSAQEMEYGKTMPYNVGDQANSAAGDLGGMNGGGIEDIPPTAPVVSGAANNGGLGATVPVSRPGFNTNDFGNPLSGRLSAGAVEDYQATQPVVLNEMSYFDPVVGWMVCISGPNRGQDYRIHAGNNRVGRNPKNDIYIKGDLTVSGENNCTISYDNRSRRFFLAAGTGKNLIYVNGEIVFNSVELHAYDVVTVGNTELIVIPLCGEKFSWDQ